MEIQNQTTREQTQTYPLPCHMSLSFPAHRHAGREESNMQVEVQITYIELRLINPV
jgi:hypothetical protein